MGRAIEVYRVRSESEMAKRLKRKLKRKREKGKEDKDAGYLNPTLDDGEGITAGPYNDP